MNKGIKIFVVLVVFLGLMSLVFLIFSKKNPVKTAVRPSQQASKKTTAGQKTVPIQKGSVDAGQSDYSSQQKSSQPNAQERKTIVRSQWDKCKNNTIGAELILRWNVQISEGIPEGGTYAKGTLDADVAYPVRIIIKTDTEKTEQILRQLTVGKMAFLKGTCAGVAPDGAIIVQAF